LDGWFLPIDAAVGRKLSDNFVMTLEVSVPVIKNFPVYELKAELGGRRADVGRSFLLGYELHKAGDGALETTVDQALMRGLRPPSVFRLGAVPSSRRRASAEPAT
jgi:hypothetical protein